MRFIKEKNVINESYHVSKFITALGSGCFVGFLPFATGTFGSFVGFLIYLIPGFSNIFVLLSATIVCFISGIYISEIMKRRYGYDPPEVVIDEIAGLWFTYLIGNIVLLIFFKLRIFDPSAGFYHSLVFGFVGFLLFRIFDIVKFQPAKYFDNMKSGFGIMMDDIVSGFYAGFLTAILSHFIWYKVFLRLS